MPKNPVKLNIELKYKKPKDALKDYCFYHIDDNFGKCENHDIIIQKINNSKIVFIDILKEKKNEMFIGLQKTVIYVQNASKQLLTTLFSQHSELKFCFLQDKKDILNEIISISKDKIFQFSESFDYEIENVKKCIKLNHQLKDPIKEMEKSIKSCISGYLIGESYFKSIEQQKIDFMTIVNAGINQKFSNQSLIKEWTEDEYIELKVIGTGSIFQTFLIFQIETGQLYVIKKLYRIDNENSKLIKRERENYLSIHHPLIPKFYGKQKENDYLVIQYIHGQTLNNIDLLDLTLDDKIEIIIELILIIDYLHTKNFVYRDLKPNNVIIDKKGTVF